jgi:hypothetical protein
MNKEFSFEKINYIFRPRKQIERKIIIELFQKIKEYKRTKIRNYRYIGMGSIYYYDFILFHKFLDIRDMTSIDDKDERVERFKFNKPYDFIKFKNIDSTSFLLEYKFDKKSIFWFDYDSLLFDGNKGDLGYVNESILNDIKIISERSNAGDFFLLSINVNPPRGKDKKEHFLNFFESKISSKYNNKRFITDENYKYVIQNIILNHIEETLKFFEKKFCKLFSFFYIDNAPMYTLGGIFDDSRTFQKNFRNELFFDISEDTITSINVPNLTYKEKLYLDSKIRYLGNILKKTENKSESEKLLGKLDMKIFSADKIADYVKYYKYYPQYYEGII